jgi:hypothetical protein
MRTQMSKHSLSCAVLVCCLLALDASHTTASADPTNIHVFSDTLFLSDYITPRGYVLNNNGFVNQTDIGITASIYSNKSGPINDVSLNAGVWEDYWEDSQFANSVSNRGWYEDDWWAGGSVTHANWTFGATIMQFRSPDALWQTQTNAEFKISHDDSGSGLPITFNPYTKLFYAISGSSTTGFGDRGHTYDVEIGMSPSYTFKNTTLTVSAPTWITVGPESFWNGDPAAIKNTGNFGVFSTGMTFKTPISFIPSSYGSWYAKAGVQVYDLINNNLVLAEELRGGVPSSDRTPVVGFTGLGVSF